MAVAVAGEGVSRMLPPLRRPVLRGPPPASADRQGEAARLHRCGALGDVCEEVIQVHRPGHRGAHLPPEGEPLPAAGSRAELLYVAVQHY